MIGKFTAMRLIEAQIGKFEEIKLQANYANLYDEKYTQIHKETKRFLSEVFSPEEIKKFEGGGGILLPSDEEDPAREVEDYINHINRYITRLKAYKEIILKKLTALTPHQLLYIETIYSYFQANGTWPTYGHLDKHFLQISPDLEIEDVENSLPHNFTRGKLVKWNPDRRAELRIPAIYILSNSRDDLNDFVHILQYCVDKYISAGEECLDISSEEVKQNLNMSDLSLRKTGELLCLEELCEYFKRGQEWRGRFTRSVRRFRKIESIEQYLEKREQIDDNTTVQTDPQNTLGKAMQTVKALFLAANPIRTERLAIDEEMRAIDQKVRAAEHRDRLIFQSAWAVRPDDVLQLLNQHRPHIVHFSGHGSRAGLSLADNDGKDRLVTTRALAALFATLKDNIRLVFLNACYSREQAQILVRSIDCVIGMKESIHDDAAIIFASSFYRAIGFGRSLQEAFDQGIASLLLERISDEEIPELLVKEGVDANKVVLIAPGHP